MTETDWATTKFRAYDMHRHARGRVSARKLQLLACGCCRLISDHLTDRQREALEVIEKHADGLATQEEYDRVTAAVGRAAIEMARSPTDPHPEPVQEAVAYALQAVVSTPADDGLRRTIEYVLTAAGRPHVSWARREVNQATQAKICDLFREVVGNPFRERAVVRPDWVQGGGGVTGWMTRVSETARAVAVGIQADRAYDRMPILADALEDEGCADHELLAHLRGSGPHVRGCWALDLVLGKS